MNFSEVNFEEVDAGEILKDIRSRALPLSIDGMREEPGVDCAQVSNVIKTLKVGFCLTAAKC
jgi:hypothetical protein